MTNDLHEMEQLLQDAPSHVPDANAPAHKYKIGAIAKLEDAAKRQEAVSVYAKLEIYSLNARLTQVASGMQETLSAAREEIDKAIDQDRKRLSLVDKEKSVTSSEEVVNRDLMARGFSTLCVVVIAILLAFGEGKLLANTVMASGKLQLNPDSLQDWMFAVAFAVPTLALAFLKRSWHVNLSSDFERKENARKTYRSARIWFFLWLPVAALLFGATLATSTSAELDPFLQLSALSTLMLQTFAEAQVILEIATYALSVLLLLFNIQMASTTIAALWIFERQLYVRAKLEKVRESEMAKFLYSQINAKEQKRNRLALLQSKSSGVLTESESRQNLFAEQILANVELIRARADLVYRKAIIEQVSGQ